MSDKRDARAAELRRHADLRLRRKIEANKWQQKVQAALDAWRAAQAAEQTHRQRLHEAHLVMTEWAIEGNEYVSRPDAEAKIVDDGYGVLVDLMDETERCQNFYTCLVYGHNEHLAMEAKRDE